MRAGPTDAAPLADARLRFPRRRRYAIADNAVAGGIVTAPPIWLLSEFPGALKTLRIALRRFATIASQSSVLSAVVDELPRPRRFISRRLPDATATNYAILLRVPEEDEEQQLEALRQFKQAIAFADCGGGYGTLPATK
ncbi:hypothetical protein KCP76_06070 [Salmonella enterica subsp. enterica serovar Weltevreden]|nr:hypothetical protein KCP76_06070 [Salmonella enterica subsp. enterica serovar Weltevreden]